MPNNANGSLPLSKQKIERLRRRVTSQGLTATAKASGVSAESITRALAGLNLRRGTIALLDKILGAS